MNFLEQVADGQIRALIKVFIMKRSPQNRGRNCGNFKTVCGAVIAILALFALTSCQGLSAGNSSSQQQTPSTDLVLGSSSLDFGKVVVGSSKTLSVTATNSGTSALTITRATPSTADFSWNSPSLPLTINAGQQATLSVAFTPTVAANASGTIAIASSASNGTVTLPVAGVGVAPGQLTANPGNLNFGTVLTGSTHTQSATLTNSGGSSVTITQAAVSGSGFQLNGLNLPLTINPGQSTTASVTFAPQTSGVENGSVTLTTSISMTSQARLLRTGFESSKMNARRMATDTGTVTIMLYGDVQNPGVLTVNPTSLSFVNVEVGTNQSQPATLTNTGGATVTVSQANVTGAGFSLSGLTLPLTLAAGQSTGFSVVFAPQSAGNVSGNVAFTSDASNPTLNLPLSGQALAQGSLTVNPTSIAFGSVQVGSSQQQPATLTNTGGSSVTISKAVASGAGFSFSGLNLPLTLAAGQNANLTVTFAPQTAGSVTGNITFTSNAPNPTLVLPLSGTGVAPGFLTAKPTSLNFGSVQVGNSNTLPEALTNTGGSNVTITQDTVSGAGFSVNGFNPPVTLTPGQTYSFSVTFAPQTAGTVNGNLAVVSNASNANLSIPLTGTGTAAGVLVITPSTLNFGNVVVGTQSTLPATLQATGASVTITAATSSSSEFTYSGLTFPLTLQAGGSQGYSVTFTPQATGGANATLTFTSNASNSPTVQNLTGNGTPPPQHSVLLSWTASTSPNIAGYNIYRSTTSGKNYSKINTSLNPGTNYTDNSVVDGVTYYYVTTAVNTGNQESTYSNQATAQIPPP